MKLQPTASATTEIEREQYEYQNQLEQQASETEGATVLTTSLFYQVHFWPRGLFQLHVLHRPAHHRLRGQLRTRILADKDLLLRRIRRW